MAGYGILNLSFNLVTERGYDMKKLIKSSRIYSHRGLVDGAILVDGKTIV